ncbi:MAG: extracellular solute-binding protein [Candidatus Brocadiia bacterium]
MAGSTVDQQERNGVETSLKRPRKCDTIVDDVRRRIAAGELTAGDRLVSLREMQDLYGVSQTVAVEAVEKLKEQELIYTRRRSGSFVAENAPQLVGEESSDSRPAQEATKPNSVSELLAPRVRTAGLTVYVSELLPRNIDIWRDVLDEFEGRSRSVECELLTGRDGHIEDILADRSVDIIQTTPEIINHLGTEDFLSFPSYEALGGDRDELLQVVADWVSRREELPGLPFSLTLHFLFRNLDLLQEAEVPTDAPTTWQQVMDRARAVNRCFDAGEKPPHGLVLTGFVDWLMATGALYLGDGQIQLDRERAREVLESFRAGQFEPAKEGATSGLFLEGRLAFHHHCSFEVPRFQREADFSWSADPVPVAADCRIKAYLVLLAIRKETDEPGAALDLCRYLCSSEVQRKFGEVPGNPSVLRDVALSDEWLARHPAGEKGVHAALKSSTLRWQEAGSDRLEKSLSFRAPFLNGEISVENTLRRLDLAVEMIHP